MNFQYKKRQKKKRVKKERKKKGKEIEKTREKEEEETPPNGNPREDEVSLLNPFPKKSTNNVLAKSGSAKIYWNKICSFTKKCK